MRRAPPESVEVIKSRRDSALARLVGRVPYIDFLGVRFDRRGDELTALLPFQPMLIGNPAVPALHGGATSAFLEITAVIELSWSLLWDGVETTGTPEALPKVPKTIDFTVDYLRSGLPRDVYARARVNRSGRRFASVHVEAWQDNKARPMAQATGHFLMS
jgi:acyl-coenzyme A thioesterase PaaI-like protein